MPISLDAVRTSSRKRQQRGSVDSRPCGVRSLWSFLLLLHDGIPRCRELRIAAALHGGHLRVFALHLHLLAAGAFRSGLRCGQCCVRGCVRRRAGQRRSYQRQQNREHRNEMANGLHTTSTVLHIFDGNNFIRIDGNSQLQRAAAPHTIRGVVNTVRAIYPGSFDPPTNGHLDLIARGSKIFDHLVVAVLNNAEKQPLFSAKDRVEMLRETTREFSNVSVETFDGLLVEFARQQRAQAVLRGIRAISDYEYEFQMALMNRRLAPELETVFMMPAEKYSYVSSRLIKQVFRLGGSVEGLVPPVVLERMRRHNPPVKQ